MKDLDINFPIEKFEKLIIDIGWESLDDWFNFWNNQRNVLSIEKFWNKKKGLFTYSVNKSLYKQTFEVEDQVIPSSNSLMANNLHELFQITRQENYLDKTKTMMKRVANKANKWLPNFTNWMLLKQKLNYRKIQYLVMGLEMNEILALHHQKKN